MRLNKVLVIATSIVMSFSFLTLSTVATSSTAQVDFEAGDLTLQSVPSVSFGEHKLSARTVVYPAQGVNGNISLIDARGNVAGWAMKVHLSEFASGETMVLPGSSIIITTPTVEQVTPARPPSYVPTELEIVAGDNASQTLWSAAQKEGNGPWTMQIKPEHVGLKVPANPDALPGAAKADLYWTLIDAPAN